ncbi:hypothetical protein ACIQGZ_25775 [Streptomyces sp. NPDC092296]|uniref:hypothetical protein n=1 Tax=Streptomyces sp. NPDC092296 TaxID=3366012 RepID=UPI0038075016
MTAPEPAPALTRPVLEQQGFTGFVTFAELPAAPVPDQGGVYVVVRTGDQAPVFLPHSTAGWRKQRDPAVGVERLAAKWVPSAEVVYIGKAAAGATGRHGLRGRLGQYRAHGLGGTSHHGGRYVWQLADSAALLVAWRTTPGEDPRAAEKALLARFRVAYGVLPFANLKG